MRSIPKALAVGAVVVPFLIGGAGAAFADAGPVYGEHTAVATENGAATSHIGSGFLGDMTGGWLGGQQGASGPSFAESERMAGPDGASSESTVSGIDGNGDAYYGESEQSAGPDGASSSSVGSRS
ncbi:hypothetical protein DSC45_18450 [Streptomyces sp. YIM 130001]|uniref:hypothetical protein n=1 Tax=Streptomyces sp. YIM 130001 TaxID=2259644 RepID=UPI000E6596A8|nr:hypothetical protein [Streptomyces sp. YIM 130001]RII15816.1 hypothetical protein DSC45_18450 [Streptomyces sp. YIM 130001]